MNDKNDPTNDAAWVKEMGNTLDRSLEELDIPVREQLARRRHQVLFASKKNRVLKRASWVSVAAAASVMAIMVIPDLHQPQQLLVQDDALLQHMELLEDMEMLEALGEEPGDV